MKVIVAKNPERVAGESLTKLLEQYQEVPILLMLSGGSALTVLPYVSLEAITNKVTITTLDERFSSDLSSNNFAQIEKTPFFLNALTKGANVISTKIEQGESLMRASERFAAALHAWRRQYSNGVILATMGIGVDGHTAGLFPRKEVVYLSDDAWVISCVVPSEINKFQERITVTYTFLRNEVSAAVVYAVGEEKRPIITQIQQSTCSHLQIPACIIGDIPRSTLITDQVNDAL